MLSLVQSVRGSVLLKQDDLRNQFYFIAVKLASPGTDCEVCEARSKKKKKKKPAGTQQFIFLPLSYPTLGSICTFTPPNTRSPVDALETKLPKALDTWIAGLAQTSGEADASGGENVEGGIDSYCISGHGANNPHQCQLDTLNTTNAPSANPPGCKTTPKTADSL